MAQVTIDIPTGSLTNAMIKAGAGISASKTVRHQAIPIELFGPAASVTALTKDIHIVSGSTGTAIRFQATINGAIATDVSRTITVDLHKSSAGGAFSTILSSTIDFTNASVLRTAVAAVFSNTSLVADDMLRIIVTVAGGSGSQATGLFAELVLEETYS